MNVDDDGAARLEDLPEVESRAVSRPVGRVDQVVADLRFFQGRDQANTVLLTWFEDMVTGGGRTLHVGPTEPGGVHSVFAVDESDSSVWRRATFLPDSPVARVAGFIRESLER